MKISDIKISQHAIERYVERFSRVDLNRLRQLAYLSIVNGINATFDETIRPMIIDKCRRHGASGAYMYENAIFFFKDDVLVTVYPISWIGANEKISS